MDVTSENERIVTITMTEKEAEYLHCLLGMVVYDTRIPSGQWAYDLQDLLQADGIDFGTDYFKIEKDFGDYVIRPQKGDEDEKEEDEDDEDEDEDTEENSDW